MSSCYRFVVSGRVQGVCYRHTAADEARRLAVTGWVRNRDDGAVEGVACGPHGALEKFRTWLNQGPPAADVDEVEWTVADEPPARGGFRIVP